MDKVFSVLLASLVLSTLVLVHTTQGEQLLPEPVCLYCALLFRSQGCLQKESALCKMIAVKFTLSVQDKKLCDNFICEPGYGKTETGTSCTGLLSCPVTKLRLSGICPTNQVCCSN